MSFENTLVQVGAANNEPRSDIYVNKLYYNQIVDPMLQNLVPNSTNSSDMTNNFNIIQAALDGGGVINFPPGTYYVNAPLFAEVNETQFIGAGIDLSVIKAGPEFSGDLFSISNSTTPVQYVTVKAITFDGNAEAQTGSAGSCLMLINAQNCLVDEVKCYCAKQEGIVITTNGSQSFSNRISNCLVQYPVTHGIVLEGFTVTGKNADVYENIISNCAITFCGGNGFYGFKASRCVLGNSVISRCNGTGLFFDNCYDCTSSNCTVNRSSVNGLGVVTCSGVCVRGCVIQYSDQGNGGDYAVSLGASCTDGVFTNNIIVEDSTTTSDSQTGPNGVVYPAKTVTNSRGFNLNATASANLIQSNYLSATVTTRFTGTGTYTNIVCDTSSTPTFYNQLNLTLSGVGLKMNSGLAMNIVTVTNGLYTATASDGIINVGGTGVATVNLPDPSSFGKDGVVFIIKNTRSSAVTNYVTISAPSTIDGTTSAIINTDYGALRVYSVGSVYYSW